MEAQPTHFMLWIDKQVLQRFNVTHYPQSKAFFTMTAQVYFLVALLYLIPSTYAFVQHDWMSGVRLTLMGAGGAVLGAILKALVKRPRPNNLITYLGKVDSSFPSSHTLIAVGLAMIATTILPQGHLAFIVIAILVGLGRMYTQMHYLTDVIGGAVIGSICAALILSFV